MYNFLVKDDCDLNDLKEMQPATLLLFSYVLNYCKQNNLEFRITSLIHDRKNIKSISNTHITGRAFDISHRSSGNWNEVHRNRMAFELNKRFVSIGAISYSDNVSRACVLKPDHFHIQVRPNTNITNVNMESL